MGSSSSKPSVSYVDNSAQINSSINKIRTQIDELNKDLTKYQEQIETHIDIVENNFKIVDNKIKTIHYEFNESFDYLNHGIKMIDNDINEMSQLQISYENNNTKEHWEIFQNDWKENIERNIFQEFQKLKNMKFELELNLHKKIGSYLLIKDHFNDKIKEYERKKNTYQLNIIQTQVYWLLNNKDNNNNNNSFSIELNKKEELELKILENDIKYPPELEDGIEEMYLMTNNFEEIIKIELKLKETIYLMMENFRNTNLLNPLDDILVKPIDFAQKLYNYGINSVQQIIIKNQNEILISNGYAYIPEYKYKDLRQKFIIGCELANLKLKWNDEDIILLSSYLYLKIEHKSISNMINILKNNNTIYQFENNEVNDIELGLTFWKILSTNHNHNFNLEYETNPIILYNIFINNDIKNINQITNEYIETCGYLKISEFSLINLQNIILKIDKHEIYGKNIFMDNNELFKITTNEKQINLLIKYIVSAYLKKDFQFHFDKFNNEIAKSFFTEITLKLLNEYINIIWFNFINSQYTNIEFTKNDLENIYLCTNIKFDKNIVENIFRLNNMNKIKSLIHFVFDNLYNFYWIKN